MSERGGIMRGHAWALADLLEPGCGGVAEVPMGTSEDDVQALEQLGAEVRRSCWVRIPTWSREERTA